MAFFPVDPTNYRPAKILFQIEVLREVDRAIQAGLGGYSNRHEMINDLVEQGLVELSYPDINPAELAEPNDAVPQTIASPPRVGDDPKADAAPPPTMPDVEPLSDLSETRLIAPGKTGAVVENELASIPGHPMFGMHNRDAPTAWALMRLAGSASAGPVDLEQFYRETTTEAWKLAAQLTGLEVKGGPKLAVMLPRNPEKEDTAEIGFRAFALGATSQKTDPKGRLGASGPFYEWGAVGVVGDANSPLIGLTRAGWELVTIFDGLDFSIPHGQSHAERFMKFLHMNVAADSWGFRTTLEGATQGFGRSELNRYFAERLPTEFRGDWKQTVANSVASGYVSRAREWGLLELKLRDKAYVPTDFGETILDRLADSTWGKEALQ